VIAEQANTIAQLRRTQDPTKFQRRTAWKGQQKGQDEQPQSMQETRPPRKRVLVQEGQAQQSSTQPTIPGKAQGNTLSISGATSDSDDEPDIYRAFCVLAWTESFNPNEKFVLMPEISEETDGMHLQEASQDQMKYNSPEWESGKYCVVPFGTLAGHCCKIVWKDDLPRSKTLVTYMFLSRRSRRCLMTCQNWKTQPAWCVCDHARQ
jgi:hypothetical protein